MFNTLLSPSVLKSAFQKSLLVTSIAALAACGSDDESISDPLPAGFELEAQVSAQFRADESYGSDERNVFDIFLPESEEPTSLIIYVHGGGFFAGDKSNAYAEADDINDVLEAGVAYATINYSLLDVPGFNDAGANDTEGLEKSLSDIKEALQYIRLNSEEYNIDPEKVAMYGVSAGAVSSLWLAYSDDMADGDASAESIASQSTRLVAAGAIETQGSLDLVRWEPILTVEGVFAFTLEQAAELGAAPFMESVYGLVSDTSEGSAASIAAIRADSGELAEYRATLDIPALMDANDPDVFVSNAAVSVTDTLTAFARVQQVAIEGAAALASFHENSASGNVEAASQSYTEAIALQAEGEELAGQLINALLHFPTHAATVAGTAAMVGATVVSNIPELADSGFGPEPTGQTVIPFLLEELEDQVQ